MNLSLKNRVALSFIFANIVVLVLSFVVFHFLDSLSKEFEAITLRSNQASLVTDEVRISAVAILKYQRRMLSSADDKSDLKNRIITLCTSMNAQLARLETLYENPDVKKILTQMTSYVDSLKLILSRATFVGRDSHQDYASIGDLADKILDSYSDFSDIQYVENKDLGQQYEEVIKEIKKNMMIILIIGFLGTNYSWPHRSRKNCPSL